MTDDLDEAGAAHPDPADVTPLPDDLAELRDAHDVLADFYVDRLAGLLEQQPEERAVLDLWAELVQRTGTRVTDVGCGTGRLLPYLHEKGLDPSGVDLSPRMVEVARRDHPGVDVLQADRRELPYADGSLDGVVCWYSLMYLHPHQRAEAYAELARVTRPGGHLATAYKLGDGAKRRGGRTTGLGVEFDVYWLTAEQVEADLAQAGFDVVFRAAAPGDSPDGAPQGYAVARRR